MQRFRDGELAAFNELYEELGDRVYGFCYRLSGNREDAEDLAADTFVAAFEGRERFEERSTISTWLYRIALYRWRRVKKRKGNMVELNENLTGEEHSCLDDLGLQQALKDLPESLAQAFVLVRCEGLRYREAAEVLNIPMGTVQYRVHEASKALRQALGFGDVPVAPQLAKDGCGYGL